MHAGMHSAYWNSSYNVTEKLLRGFSPKTSTVCRHWHQHSVYTTWMPSICLPSPEACTGSRNTSSFQQNARELLMTSVTGETAQFQIILCWQNKISTFVMIIWQRPTEVKAHICHRWCSAQFSYYSELKSCNLPSLDSSPAFSKPCFSLCEFLSLPFQKKKLIDFCRKPFFFSDKLKTAGERGLSFLFFDSFLPVVIDCAKWQLLCLFRGTWSAYWVAGAVIGTWTTVIHF